MFDGRTQLRNFAMNLKRVYIGGALALVLVGINEEVYFYVNPSECPALTERICKSSNARFMLQDTTQYTFVNSVEMVSSATATDPIPVEGGIPSLKID